MQSRAWQTGVTATAVQEFSIGLNSGQSITNRGIGIQINRKAKDGTGIDRGLAGSIVEKGRSEPSCLGRRDAETVDEAECSANLYNLILKNQMIVQIRLFSRIGRAQTKLKSAGLLPREAVQSVVPL
jgi:hypothetical protein